MDLLYPTTSTTVHPGGSVSVDFDFVHVPTRPSDPTLYYKGPHGVLVSTTLDLYDTGAIAIPSTWKPGIYKLEKVETDVLGSTGVQYRDHRFVGTTNDGTTVYGTSKLNLKLMDLRVTPRGHCHHPR